MCAWVLEQLLFLAQDSGLLFLHCITEKHPPASRTQSNMPAMPTMRAASSCKQGPALLLTKTQKRNMRKRRQRLSCYPAPPLGHHGALSEPTKDDSSSHGRLLQLSERTVGTLFSAAISELPSKGIKVPSLPINNHAAHSSEGTSDTVYVLLTNIKVDSLARRDDRARHEDLPPGVCDFACGPYKLPILRPGPLPFPNIPGVVVYPTTEQHAERQYASSLEDLPPHHRVRVTSNTVVHVESALAAKDALVRFAEAAIASFGVNSCLDGSWSAYIGKHNDCAADNGHPDAFSRVFQINGPAAEMARTRSSIGYGPSVGHERKAALLTIRNVKPRCSEHYKGQAARRHKLQSVTGKSSHTAPIPSDRNCTGWRGVSYTRGGRYTASIRVGEGGSKRCLGSFDSAHDAACAYATAEHQRRQVMLEVAAA